MHVILGTAGLDDAQKLRNLKPSAHLAGYTSVTPSFSSLGGLAMLTLEVPHVPTRVTLQS